MTDSTPFVSVICPLYNSENYISTLLDSLLSQTYPEYEVICIDNGSSDRTLSLLKKYDIKILQESVKSSYAARNKGIEHAKGSILAFIDSDCIADSNWLKEGINSILSGSDIIAGKVEFYFKSPNNPWEIYDATFHMDQKRSTRKGYSATANLFVRKEVFLKQGLFNPKATSGEDKAWTSGAVKAGFKLSYSPKALVKHPTRQKPELINKALRTGGGFLNTIRKENPVFKLALTTIFITKNAFPFPLGLSRIYLRNNTSLITKIETHLVLIVIKNIRSIGLLLNLFGKRIR